MKKIALLILLPLLFFTCHKDNRERLFEMVYPDTRFEILAGWSATFPRVFELPSVATNVDFYLDSNSADPAAITAIHPLTARITSLDGAGVNYDFINEISVRICPAGTAQCTSGDEVFYIDDLQNRGGAGNEIDLLPTLRNVKPQLLEDNFRLEVVFFFAYTTPWAVESRLDMVFEAVR